MRELTPYEKYLINKGEFVAFDDVPALLAARLPQIETIKYAGASIEFRLKQPVRGWRTYTTPSPSDWIVKVDDVNGLAQQMINWIENGTDHSIFADAMEEQ